MPKQALTLTSARHIETYRFAKRNRARALRLVWRRLPRIVLSRTNQVIVDFQ